MYEEHDGIKMTDDRGPQTGPVVRLRSTVVSCKKVPSLN
jgi:hypothetical protein